MFSARMDTNLRRVLGELVDSLSPPRTLLTYAHRTYPNAMLARDLLVTAAKADKALHAGVQRVSVACSVISPACAAAVTAAVGAHGFQSLVRDTGLTPTISAAKDSNKTKATRLIETLHAFFQLCVQADLLTCVNVAERAFLPDCFYVISEREPPRDPRAELSTRRMLEVLNRMRRLGVEVKDRRFSLRAYPACFVRAEAVKWLESVNYEAPDEFLRHCQQEGTIVSVLNAPELELFQFVPRVVHSGFVYVGGAGNWTRRWAVLREYSLLLFNETKRQQLLSETSLPVATCNEVSGVFSSTSGLCDLNAFVGCIAGPFSVGSDDPAGAVDDDEPLEC